MDYSQLSYHEVEMKTSLFNYALDSPVTGWGYEILKETMLLCKQETGQIWV
jgi:hypothetical protein